MYLIISFLGLNLGLFFIARRTFDFGSFLTFKGLTSGRKAKTESLGPFRRTPQPGSS